MGRPMIDFEALHAADAASLSLVRERDSDGADAGDACGSGNPSIAAAKLVRSARIKSPKLVPHKKAAPEKVLRSFNTWAFKREQPADPQLMLQIISEAVSLGEPVSFVLYWGKGPRCRLNDPDIECLDYLSALARRVSEAYEPGAAVRLIFTDTHAVLNGHSRPSMREYFGAVEAGAHQRGFETCWLSELMRAAKAVTTREASDDALPADTLRRLSVCAAKWYRGDGTAEQGALKYYQTNMVEKRAVELAFPGSIFITFNGSEFRCLFPDRLPIFYMYSLRRGVSVKPWFLPAAAASLDAERTDRPG